jgi:eukaryotic-like serine/threonine-protein kinase
VVAAPADDEDQFLDEDEEPKSRAGLAVLIGALVLLLLIGGSYALWRLMGADTPEAAAKVAVPNVLTYNEQQATERLTESQLKAEVKHVNGDEKTTGQVTKQDPAAGTEVEQNSTVMITVNDGPKTAKIPTGLKGDDVDDARAELEKKKFSNVTTREAAEEPSDAKAGEVLSVVPAEGSTVPLDQKITLTYATGKSKVPVLTGKTPAQAESDARTAGFTKFNKDEVETDNEPAGVVFEQNPAAGETVARSTTISYKVAVAPPEPGPTTVTTTAPPPPPTRTPTRTPSPTPTPTETSSPGG